MTTTNVCLRTKQLIGDLAELTSSNETNKMSRTSGTNNTR